MKRRIKAMCVATLLLIFSMISTISVSAAVKDEPVVQPQYTYIDYTAITFTDVGDGTAEFIAECGGVLNVTSIKFEVTLQKRGLLGIYTKVDSVTKTVSGNSYAYLGYFDIEDGETYRVKSKVTVTCNGNTESDTITSDPI